MPTSPRTRTTLTRRVSTAALIGVAGAGALLGTAGTASANASAGGGSSTEAAPAAVAPAPEQASSDSVGQQIVDAAASQAGKPYVYGGNGPDNFDCSGLTKFAHAQAGIELPRTSSDQAASVKQINKADKQPGDMIFFSDGGSVYHVGIFAGGNQMWAAPESGDVVKQQTIWSESYSVGRAW